LLLGTLAGIVHPSTALAFESAGAQSRTHMLARPADLPGLSHYLASRRTSLARPSLNGGHGWDARVLSKATGPLAANFTELLTGPLVS
jgi:hypothetical protein